MSWRKSRAPGLRLVAVVSLLLSGQVWGGALGRQACAAEGNHAGMVIRFSAATDSHRSWCLQFSQESLSGIEALRLTGLPIVTKTFGSDGEYVCKIGNVGTEAADCPAKDGSYWGYWRMTSQGWRHSGIGASAARVRCGSLEGWAWLQGGTGPAPEAAEFSSICKSADCRAAPSVISASPLEGTNAQPQPGKSDYEAAQPRAAAPNNPPGRDGATNGETDPVRSGPANGSGDPGGLEARASSAGAPVDGASAGAPGKAAKDQLQAEVAAETSGVPPQRPIAVDDTGTDASRKPPWKIPSGLAAVIAVLASVRAYLFWRSRL